MSRDTDKHFDRRPLPGRARATDAGIARGPGLVVAGVTAAIVFVIGWQLFPVRPRTTPTPPAPTVAVTPPPVAPPAVVDAAAPLTATAPEGGATTAAAASDASAGTAGDASKTSAVAKEEAAAPSKPAAEAPSDDTAAPGHKAADKQDKDLAREAWRRNRPDISIVGNKTAIMVPIRGSIRGSDFKVINKPRSVVVTLPKAVSMVTLRVYNMKHPLFRKVWIDQDEANAQPDDGTKLRFILSPQTYDPQVEITDDFVRVTIRRPDSGDSQNDGGEARPAKKRSERAEKHSEPAEEAAAPEKEAE